MFEQAAIAVRDEQGYQKLHALIDAAFDARDVEVFLNSVSRKKLRVRDYEGILKRGLLESDLKQRRFALVVSTSLCNVTAATDPRRCRWVCENRTIRPVASPTKHWGAPS